MPPTPQPRTHYDTLGVSRNASQDEVKKRYRELARKHHPDVNPGDPNAARLFTEITAAYKVLSDGSSRQTYDAELLLQEKRAANAQARARANEFPGTTTYYPPGGGTASPPPRPAQPRPQNAGAGAAANAQNVANEVSRLLQQAQAALVRMRFLEARDLAQQSLRLKRTAEGYEILGDVYRLQNRADDAMNMYTMSLQLDPRNQRVMDRLQRIARATSRPTPQSGGSVRPSAGGYEAPRPPGPAMRPAGPPPGTPAYLRSDRGALGGLLVAFMGYGAVALLLAYVALFGREAPVTPLTPVSLVSQWNGTLLWALPLIGVLLGVTMAVTGAIRRIDDELVFAPRPGGRRSAPQVPMGLVLLGLSVVSFWAAALLHTIIAALQEARLDTLLRAFGAVAGVVLFVTAVYDPGRAQVFLFGGNVVFLAFAFGWLLGDIFRPEY